MEWPGKDGKHPRCPPKGNVAKGNNKLVGYFFSLHGFRVALVSTWHAGEFDGRPLELLMVILGLNIENMVLNTGSGQNQGLTMR